MNLTTLEDDALLDATRVQVLRSAELDADLILLLGEVDHRKLYAERGYSSMFQFCLDELGFSEDQACNRIDVARLARRIPRALDFLRSGAIHLTGLRLLDPHLTPDNAEQLLSTASHKSKRQLLELLAALAPRPDVAPSVRKLPAPRPPAAPLFEAPAVDVPTRPPALAAPERRPVVEPLAPERYRVEFTADRALKEKLQQAEELLRHRIRKGDIAAVVDRALDLLIAEVKKERFGVGRKPRSTAAEAEQRESVTRHVPDAIKREVYERDGGQCAYVAPDGRRCQERGALELEHRLGFARTGEHRVDDMALYCRCHNGYAAEQLYGREKMERMRHSTRSGTGAGLLL